MTFEKEDQKALSTQQVNRLEISSTAKKDKKKKALNPNPHLSE